LLTLVELKEKLVEQVDEITLIEILNLTTEDIVEAFSDKIEEQYEKLQKEYDDTENS
jgi:hypothetical protein